MEDKEFHLRAKQKKHEADLEKDKIKKSILYMEAVCNFFPLRRVSVSSQ